jgi:general secretion pathway protein G
MKSKKAFTMIELVFVVVIIGILASVAIPRLAATRDDAQITKGRTTLSVVRNALAMERQKRILRGEFGAITALTNNTNVFGTFKAKDSSGVEVDTGISVLDYPMPSESKRYHWKVLAGGWYAFCLNDTCASNGDAVWFQVNNGKFICREDASHTGKCSILGVTAQ